MGELQFTATLQARGPAAAVVLDDAHAAAVGEGAKRFPVVATVAGHSWRGSVARMGSEYLLGLSRDVRDAAGVQAGDTVDVVLRLDTQPREVEAPEALTAALADNPDARAAFQRLAYTHRKEFARWIADATRDRRVTQTLQMLREGNTRS
jgi:hypothetical protein